MPQVRYFFRAGKGAAEAAYARLDAAFEEEGAPLAIAEIDEARAIFEVSAYLETEPGGDRAADVAAAADLDSPDAVSREELPEQDWMAAVLAALKPVRAGRFLVHGAHDRDRVAVNDLAIEIEAGQAFGTGHHGTTAGCLTMIGDLALRNRPRNALDLGTGSAVLAIGLAKLARIPVLATDIDPVAVDVAAANIAANGVSHYVETAVSEGFRAPAVRQGAPYDLIVANILAGPLIALARDFRQFIAPRGDIVLSGILTHQRAAVLAAFRAQGMIHRRTLTRGEWVTLHLSR
ncbi:50S ribosomal protein L11 methyltransferase [Jiella sp. M17.18]|uniref:50S ribosomal protein L11 methyltransferase n=1 Tax=Jiella sp. M17.18 TaxID=3234247 RepID=UPI0034DE9168